MTLDMIWLWVCLTMVAVPGASAWTPVKPTRASFPHYSVPSAVELQGEEAAKTNEIPSFIQSAFEDGTKPYMNGISVTSGPVSECDDSNLPPSLNILLQTVYQLGGIRMTGKNSQNSDIRGVFVDHPRYGSTVSSVASILKKHGKNSKYPALTPLLAYSFGYALGDLLLEEHGHSGRMTLAEFHDPHPAATLASNYAGFAAKSPVNVVEEAVAPPEPFLTVAVGCDPRPHGPRLADALCRGLEDRGRAAAQQNESARIRTVFVSPQHATTPACAYFCSSAAAGTEDRPNLADAAVMVTASHLPVDRNGFKVFRTNVCDNDAECLLQGPQTVLTTAAFVHEWARRTARHVSSLYTGGLMIPPSSGPGTVYTTGGHVPTYMNEYAEHLKRAVYRELSIPSDTVGAQPLAGLKIVLNAGYGSGGFFQQVLEDLGADTTGSIGCDAAQDFDQPFPLGVPNPEYPPMIEATMKACKSVQADLGIMLDTDADRCGFVVPSVTGGGYEPLNRNRLIALLGVVMSRQYTAEGCTVVTDSVTSEGLTVFLQDCLGLQHHRYLKGYANVIGKARELTEAGACNAALAIETSGHCAFRENGYMDDGTYTAVKVVSLLATEQSKMNQRVEDVSSSLLLDLIKDMPELDEIHELRMTVFDGSLETMRSIFDRVCQVVGDACGEVPTWAVDQENLEGIRVRVRNTGEQSAYDIAPGSFFMLRPSLHDPIISLQVEGSSRDEIRQHMIALLLHTLLADEAIRNNLDTSVLSTF
jgi:phosphomannomutase